MALAVCRCVDVVADIAQKKNKVLVQMPISIQNNGILVQTIPCSLYKMQMPHRAWVVLLHDFIGVHEGTCLPVYIHSFTSLHIASSGGLPSCCFEAKAWSLCQVQTTQTSTYTGGVVKIESLCS